MHDVNRDTEHIDIVYFSLCMYIFFFLLNFMCVHIYPSKHYFYIFDMTSYVRASVETTELYIQFVPFCSTWYDS